MKGIKKNELPEFLGQVIDVFEDFLEEKEVALDNPDRDGKDAAILYGTDYGDLQDRLTSLVESCGLVEPEGIRCCECAYRCPDGDCGKEMCHLEFTGDGLCKSGVRK